MRHFSIEKNSIFEESKMNCSRDLYNGKLFNYKYINE